MANISFIAAGKLSDLLRSADPDKKMYVRVLSATHLALGTDPLQPSDVIDLSGEKISPFVPRLASESFVGAEPPRSSPDHVKVARRSGQYWFEIDGRRTDCGSLKHLLAEGLRALERKSPGTLGNLSRLRGRTRRIVARDVNQLFDKPHLARQYGERLTDGWYFGTNNSARETGAWLERAAECAGLKLGSNFKTSLG